MPRFVVVHVSILTLVAQLLTKDVHKRPTIEQVMQHPYVSGKIDTGGRLAGEEAVWDVFISYRVATDVHHASALYHALTAAGLRVFWDKKSLRPGEDWEDGFVKALIHR